MIGMSLCDVFACKCHESIKGRREMPAETTHRDSPYGTVSDASY